MNSTLKLFLALSLAMANALAFQEDFSSWSQGTPAGWSKPYYQEGDWSQYNESGLYYLWLLDNSTATDYALMHDFPYTPSDSFVIQARARHLAGYKGIIFMLPDFKISLSFQEMENAGVDVSKWHEYTVVYNGSSYNVYVDGRKLKTKNLETPMTGNPDYNGKIWVLYSTTSAESEALMDYILWEKAEDWNGLFLEPDCSAQPDENGYVKLSARTGWLAPDGNVYCNKVRVTAAGQDLKKTSPECVLSRYVFLPAGGVVDFTASSDSGGEKTVSCYYPPSPASFSVDILSPQDGAVLLPGQASVKAFLYLSGEKLYSGTAVVTVYDSQGNAVESKELDRKLGTFIGTVSLSEGEYTLTVTGEYEGLSANASVRVTVSSTQTNATTQPGVTAGNWTVDVITPRPREIRPGIVPVQVKLTNPEGFRTTKPDLELTVYRDGEVQEQKKMQKGPYTYFTTINATLPGSYSFGFTVVSDGVTVQIGTTPEKAVNVTGPSPYNATPGKLRIDIFSPRPDVYALNSTIMVRATVYYEDQITGNARVRLYFMGQEHNMSYEEGDYVYPLPLLEEGDYSVKIFADYNGYTATEGVDFQVSSHYLTIEIVSPRAQEYVDQGDKIPLKVNVYDEKGDPVIGAFVTADLVEADGRTHTFQLYQSAATKTYSTVFYPNVEGVQRITFTASKPGYVPAAEDYKFEVIMKEKEVLPVEVDISTIYLVIGIVALLILIAALVKLVL